MNKQITVFSGVCVRENKVLMVLRDEGECPDAHLKWNFPGGKCDFGETPEESLIREFEEETSVSIRVKELLPLIQTSYWDYAWGKQQTLCFVFVCEFISEHPVLKNDHHVKEIAWLTVEDAEKVPSLPGTKEALSFLKNRNYFTKASL